MSENWKLGIVVHDVNKHPWIYIGSQVTRAKTIQRFFVKAYEPHRIDHYPWTYHAVKYETLQNRFPDLSVEVLSA